MLLNHEPKKVVQAYQRLFYDVDKQTLQGNLAQLLDENCEVYLPHPLGKTQGAIGLYEQGFKNLLDAIPDFERREFIHLGGSALEADEIWVGSAGYYCGTFMSPWLDIPSTGHYVYMRYHEFFRILDNKIVEIRALWDIPQLMMQAHAWPMSVSLGVETLVPGPATQDGVITYPVDPESTTSNLQLVKAMLDGLGEYAKGGVDAMDLGRYWHPKMNWYGPAGIGINRQISGFRLWHQIPFLAGMPNRSTIWSTNIKDDKLRMFGEGNYVGLFGWPALTATISDDGWLGIVPNTRPITLRSLDFWRCENGLIRENWVLVDLLDIYAQLSVDVLERMREMTFIRQPKSFRQSRYEQAAFNPIE